MTILIGLNGYKGSGKDTAAGFIEQWGDKRNLVTVKKAFADLLKLSAMRSLGMTTNLNDAITLADSLKRTGTIDVSIPEQSILQSISGREYLKWFGTEGHRDVFGEDFWVDQLLPAKGWIYNFSYIGSDGRMQDPDIVVITDTRFANEARRIRRACGYVWNIDRGYNPDSDGHMSEQPLPSELIDLIISNKSSLEHLEVSIMNTMTREFGEVTRVGIK